MSRGREVQGLVWVAISRRFEPFVILAFSQSMCRDWPKAAMRSMIDRKILNMNMSDSKVRYLSMMEPRGLLCLQDATRGYRFLSALYIFNLL